MFINCIRIYNCRLNACSMCWLASVRIWRYSCLSNWSFCWPWYETRFLMPVMLHPPYDVFCYNWSRCMLAIGSCPVTRFYTTILPANSWLYLHYRYTTLGNAFSSGQQRGLQVVWQKRFLLNGLPLFV